MSKIKGDASKEPIRSSSGAAKAAAADRCNRIRGLRKKIGNGRQAPFAELLGVRQSTISAWELPGTGLIPSPEFYIKLGNLADYPECVWFWKQAGIDRELMIYTGQKILEKRGKVPPVGKVIEVPDYREEGDPWYLDARIVPNPGAVCYYVVKGHEGRGLLTYPGTVIFLDRADKNAPNLEPFLEKIVLLKSVEGPSPQEPNRVIRGVHLGRLRSMKWPGDGNQEVTFLGCSMDFLNDPLFYEGLRLPGSSDCFPVGYPALFHGTSIVGRVIDWFRPPQINEEIERLFNPPQL